MTCAKVIRNSCLALLLLPTTLLGQASVDLKLGSTVQDQKPAQLQVVITSSQQLAGANVELTAPLGFKLDPMTLTLPAFTNSLSETVVLKAVDAETLPGKKFVEAKLYDPATGKSKSILASAHFEFNYVVTDISLRIYFVMGVLGVFFGYWIRLLVKVLGTVPAPPPAPVPGAAVGPITAFVQKHYYLVDLLVTLLLGFLVLVSLVQGNRPPQVGSHWYTALTAGVGLGLFTNSDLITKLRR